MNAWSGGLPPSAHERVERQRASGVSGSLLSAPAAAALRTAGLTPVGEVFGCIVMNLGWQQGYCGAYNFAMRPTSGYGQFGGGPFGNAIPGGFAGQGYGNAYPGFGGGFGPGVMGWTSPVITSGQHPNQGFGPYVHAYEQGWYGAVQRMVAEAKALGAEGVVGVVHGRSRLEGTAFEYTALGTAVRAVDRSLAASALAPDEVWASNLSAEDSAAAIRSGHMPVGVALGLSVSTKHKDWALKQQESVWAGNTEIQGMTELITAARHDARAAIAARGRRFGGGDLVITSTGLGEFETPCRSAGGEEAEEDLHAEAVFVGTVLAPASAALRHARRDNARVLSVLPLTDRSA